MKKRLLAIIATMAMVVTMIPATAFAAGGIAKITGGAEYPSLTEAIANCNTGDTITITGEVEMMGVEGTSKVTDLKGVTVVGSSADATIKFVNYTGSNVTGTGTFSNMNLKNLKVVDETFYTGENGENAWEFTYLEIGGNNTFENVDFTDGIMVEPEKSVFNGCTFRGHNNDSSEHGNGTMYGVWVGPGDAEVEAVFNGCDFVGTRGLKVHKNYSEKPFKVTVDGCTFKNLTEKPGIAIGTPVADSVLTVTNSAFINCAGGDQNLETFESDVAVGSFKFTFDENNEVGEYAISYDLAGGTVAKTNPKTYDAETNTTLNNPTREGYKFLGWTGSNGNEPQTEVVINGAGTTGDLGYVANWEAIQAPAPEEGTTGGEAVEQPDAEEPVEETEDAVDTGDNMNMAIPFAIAGLALAAMAAVVATRRRTN